VWAEGRTEQDAERQRASAGAEPRLPDTMLFPSAVNLADNPTYYFEVNYTDGDSETMTLRSLKQILQPSGRGSLRRLTLRLRPGRALEAAAAAI
jgi:hypothetical protein